MFKVKEEMYMLNLLKSVKESFKKKEKERGVALDQ